MSQQLSVQIVIDSEKPHELADWWAETLGWQVEPQDATFIQSMIDKGLVTEADTIVHNGSLVFASATAVRPDEPKGSGQPRLLFQQVPETKTVKNRIHLDLRHDRDSDFDLAAFRASLIERTTWGLGT